MSASPVLDSPDTWLLKGEGNAHAVFSYAGQKDHLVNQVLRIRKAVKNKHTNEAADTQIWGQGATEAQDVSRYLGPMLGWKYVATGVTVKLSHDFITKLSNHNVQAMRPAAQLSVRGQLMKDHTLFEQSPLQGGGRPALCVEMKPKWGALPTSPALPSNSIKRQMSRYQLHQRLKLSQGQISKVSSYDPLDLFSTDPNRMQKALLALFEDPQNNLRVFLAGKPLHLDDQNSMEVSAAAISEAFGQELASLPPLAAVQVLVSAIKSVLTQEGLLSKLLDVQKLDVHDIQAIHPLYLHCCQQPDGTLPHVAIKQPGVDTCPPQQTLSEPDKKQLYVKSLLERPRVEQLTILRKYLVAAAAKDCSILITLQIASGSAGMESQVVLTLPSGQHSAQYKVAVVDLDMKSSAKIPLHHALDCLLVN